MKVGDVVAWPKDHPFDPIAIAHAMRQRGALKRSIASNRSNHFTGQAAKILREAAEREARQADPNEAVRSFLQRRGYRVYSRSVIGGEGIQVGRMAFGDWDAVHQYAMELGFCP
jgi:hypothetical protein